MAALQLRSKLPNDGPDLAEGPWDYEVWAADQSNSVPNMTSRGVNGSFIWIWRSKDIERQIRGSPDAEPIGCGPQACKGPCNLLEVFPPHLAEVSADGKLTGQRLGDLPGFGRLHGTIQDPWSLYVAASIFVPNGGFVGIIDTTTKSAVALFRVTLATFSTGEDEVLARSIHMCYWSACGKAVILANLHGKILERIDVTRNEHGKIVGLAFNRAASLGVGKGMRVNASATVFWGLNQHGRPLIGEVTGNYQPAAFSDLTPAGVCKENGCHGPAAAAGGRPNNVIICPIPSRSGNVYVTLGGGGLLIADVKTTPMQIVAEYGNEVVNGAGCGGVQAGRDMYINAGVSASAAGATQSTFTVYAFDDAWVARGRGENAPSPRLLFKDRGNTATLGNNDSTIAADISGQVPGQTTRRDAHGGTATVDERYVHFVDRIQNTVDVFKSGDDSFRHVYDLTSYDGKGGGGGVCQRYSVAQPGLLARPNDPAPDLLDKTPDGKYLMIAFRGPAPVTVAHAAQGSCPGVGVVELTAGGASGRLTTVLRTVNTVDTAPVAAPGGLAYAGSERSDIHGTVVIYRRCPRQDLAGHWFPHY